jgi:hypothetical protein
VINRSRRTVYTGIGRGAPGSGRALAVLAFHKIGEPSDRNWPTWNYISEATFAGYLGWLRDDGWSVIEAATFVRGLADPAGLPERAVLLTFDDAIGRRGTSLCRGCGASAIRRSSSSRRSLSAR